MVKGFILVFIFMKIEAITFMWRFCLRPRSEKEAKDISWEKAPQADQDRYKLNTADFDCYFPPTEAILVGKIKARQTNFYLDWWAWDNWLNLWWSGNNSLVYPSDNL